MQTLVLPTSTIANNAARERMFCAVLLLLMIPAFASPVLAQTNTFPSSGDVGIGTTSPSTKVHIVTGNSAEGSVRIENSSASYSSGISFFTSSWAERGFVGWRGDSSGSPFTQVGMFLINKDNSNLVLGTNNQAQLTIDTNGDVSIGGDLVIGGNIAARYQDLAEWVPAVSQIEPGTVVIVDPDSKNTVAPSAQAYDTRVAGVVSAQPGIVLGERSDDKVKVATTGRVRVHVDASRRPIRAGDLLVSSDKPGVAMKSEPVSFGGIEMHRPGTLIGKALEPLAEGEGEILVLLSLQ